jgi:hypothetical protein
MSRFSLWMYISGKRKGRGAEVESFMYGRFQLGVQNNICATVAERGFIKGA